MTVNTKNLIEYWTKSSDKDWEAYKALRKAKQRAHALFFLHLSLEKLLKALIVSKTKSHAPFNHNLSYLLGKADIEDVPESYLVLLDEMSQFSSKTRYPDEKLLFYKSITLDVSNYWHSKGTALRKWLKSLTKSISIT